MKEEFFQEGYDTDFFAMDLGGNLVHFASGGGRIPKNIHMSGAWNGMTKAFFEKMPISCVAAVNPDLDLIKRFNSIKDRDFYLNSFIEMASRGLYSFDNSAPGMSMSFKYHLVAYPTIALKYEIIASEIGKKLVQLPINLHRLRDLDFEEIKLS